jgi:hypothetical protein
MVAVRRNIQKRDMAQFLDQDKPFVTGGIPLSDYNVFMKFRTEASASYPAPKGLSLFGVTRDLVSEIDSYPLLYDGVRHLFWTNMITYLP